jgi:hypothetical protein
MLGAFRNPPTREVPPPLKSHPFLRVAALGRSSQNAPHFRAKIVCAKFLTRAEPLPEGTRYCLSRGGAGRTDAEVGM